MWAVLVITITLRLNPKKLEIFNICNIKTSDLGYYASFDGKYLQKCDFALKTILSGETKEDYAMVTLKNKKQIHRSRITFHQGITLLIISGDIASTPGPIKFPYTGFVQNRWRKHQKAYNVKNVYYGIILNVSTCHSNNILYSASYLLVGIAANLLFPTLLNHSLKHQSLKVALIDSDYLSCDTLKTSGVNKDNVISDDEGDIFEDLKTLRCKHPTQFLCAY